MATTALLATALTPSAGAAGRPTRAEAIGNAAEVLVDRAAALGLGAAQTTTVRDVVVDADGTRHVRYDRTYRQLPLRGGDFVVHLAPGGDYLGADRATTRAISVPTTVPSVKAPRAADLAASALRTTRERQGDRRPADAGHQHIDRPGAPTGRPARQPVASHSCRGPGSARSHAYGSSAVPARPGGNGPGGRDRFGVPIRWRWTAGSRPSLQLA